MSSQRSYDRNIWTYEDYLHLDDGLRYEVLQGVLTMAPAPGLQHQDIVRDLGFLLWGYVRQMGLGKVYSAPVDVVLDRNIVLQPDLLFVATERQDILHPRGIMGAPDLVVEIISPSSLRLDRYGKKELYERFGVREYWIIDPGSRSVEVFVLTRGSYKLGSFASEKGVVHSAVLEGFGVDIGAIIPR